MRNGGGGGGAEGMDLARLPSSALRFPGWKESGGGGSLEAAESPSFDSGYLSLKGPPSRPWSPSEQEPEERQRRVDFFRKLGYSEEEVLAVLQTHGCRADTNTLLGELVKSGTAAGEKDPVAEAAPDAPEAPPEPRAAAAPAPAMPSEEQEGDDLRPVVIDGSNVAMSHGDKGIFSCRGILLAVDWFLERGHKDITVFVPSWRKEQPRPDVAITDQHILRELEKKNILVFTPSRRVGGKRVVCYDDRFIVKLAWESDGIVVSNDVYRDLQAERPEWKKFIEQRLLMYSFVNDRFMPPDDPLGRHGPSLDNFLRKKPVVAEHKKQQCPYGKKCTYGIKCKFYHPERLHPLQRSVADELRANARLSPPRGGPATKEEWTSRRPSQGEFLGSASPPEGEKARAVPKARPGEGSALLLRGGLHGASIKKGHGYRTSEQYLLPPRDLPQVSQEPLDSGIGSLDSQLSEMWPSPGQRNRPELLGASGCRGQGPPYLLPAGPEARRYGPYLPQGHYKPSFLPYSSEGSPSGPGQVAPHSFPGYGVAPDSLLGSGQAYWSEPYHPGLAVVQDPPRGPHPPYRDASGGWAGPEGFAEERAKVHVKLCGIFHPHLVQAVMRRFPQLLDPQKLAAEILTYKSQHPGG